MIVLVTGATAGFGEQIAISFVKAGHTVIATGRREDKLQALHKKYGRKLIPLAFDLADIQATEEAISTIPNELLYRIDVLINNAGVALGLEPAYQADFGNWHSMINLNILGLTNLTHLILPYMVAKNSGHIINIGSIAGTYPYYGGNVYGATKAFVKQFSLNLRADLYEKNVRVTNIEPGLCGGTEFSENRFNGDKLKAKKVYENIDYVTAKDVANIVKWVADQPSHVNINSLEVMPTAQTFAGLKVHRKYPTND